MSKYTPHVKMEPLDFEGDLVELTLRRLRREHFTSALPNLQKIATLGQKVAEEHGVPLTVQKEVDGQAEEVSNPELEKLAEGQPEFVEAMVGVLNEIADVVPQYVVEGSYRGPKDADGKEIPLKTVLEEAYFFKLAIRIVMTAVASAKAGAIDKGKAASPSVA